MGLRADDVVDLWRRSEAGTGVIRVLLVDDHPVVRRGYRCLLEEAEGIEVVGEAGETEAAGAAFAALDPDVLATDWSMPGGGGLALIGQVLASRPDGRTLVFSMHDHPMMVRRAFQAGALGFVAKAGPPEALVLAIRAVHVGERYLGPGLAPLLSNGRDPHAGSTQESRRLAELSARELDVFRLLAQGHTAMQCARVLKLSPKTVSNHQTLIKDKLGVATSAALAHVAMRHRLIDSMDG